MIYGPLDIEGHFVPHNHSNSDYEEEEEEDPGTIYICDTARVFPPEAIVKFRSGEEKEIVSDQEIECPNPPDFCPKMPQVVCLKTGRPTGYLYRLLRPELVLESRVPLSSDAFSNFGVYERIVNDQEVAEATANMFRFNIPNLAKKLDDGMFSTSIFFREDVGGGGGGQCIFPQSRKKQSRSLRPLVDLLHSHGINLRFVFWTISFILWFFFFFNLILSQFTCRWAGYLRCFVKNQHIRKLLLSEIVHRFFFPHLYPPLFFFFLFFIS